MTRTSFTRNDSRLSHVARGLAACGAVVVLAMALAACGTDEPPDPPVGALPVRFDTAQISLVSGADTIPMRVELAATDEQRQFGLMVRPSLAADAGMLFLYDSIQPPDAGFWMFRTRMPLDIAFLDSAGTIRAIRTMVPCTATLAQGCPTYPPGVPYRSALEVNQGYFARHSLAIGDRVLLGDLQNSPRR